MSTRLLLFLLAAALSAPLRAQRPELNTQADVEQHVMNALAADKAQGKLAELALELGLRGSFTFDLTVGDKGNVLTIFPVEWTIAEIPARNRIKSCLMGLKFNFKTPKDKRFKSRQILEFP